MTLKIAVHLVHGCAVHIRSKDIILFAESDISSIFSENDSGEGEV
jgi:hypothetical protein